MADLSLPSDRKVSRCSFHVSYQNWSRSCTWNPRGPALWRWWAPGTCGKTLWCCVSTRKCVVFVSGQHLLCSESVNYTRDCAPDRHEDMSVKLAHPVADGYLRCRLLIVCQYIVCAGWQVTGYTTASPAAWWTRRPSPLLCATLIITQWWASLWQPAWHSARQWVWWVGVEACSPLWS